jgi:hypothetical protein
MEPMETFFHPYDYFIKMSHVRSQDSQLYLRFNLFKVLIHAGISGQGGALIERIDPQIPHELFDLLVVVIQKSAQRLDATTIFTSWLTSDGKLPKLYRLLQTNLHRFGLRA